MNCTTCAVGYLYTVGTSGACESIIYSVKYLALVAKSNAVCDVSCATGQCTGTVTTCTACAAGY